MLLALVAACVAWGCAAYIESRVVSAITGLARQAGLDAHYASARVRSWHLLELRDLTFLDADRKLRMDLSLLVLRSSPWLGPIPHRVSAQLPQQHASLRFGELTWESKLQGQVDLVSDGPRPWTVRGASIAFKDASLSSRKLVAPGLSGMFELFPDAGSERAKSVRGRFSMHGPAAAALVEVTGSAAVLDWFFPEAVLGPFELDADLRWTPAGLLLDRIHGRCGTLAIRGALAWGDGRPNGALLLATPLHSVGLRVIGGKLHPELTPGATWLEQQLDRHALGPLPRGTPRI